MHLTPTNAPPRNHITDAIKANGNDYVSITSDASGRPAGTKVTLSNGVMLGAVQSVTWTARLGEMTRCTIETVATPADLKAMMENTTVHVRPWGHPIIWVWTYYAARVARFCRTTIKRLRS